MQSYTIETNLTEEQASEYVASLNDTTIITKMGEICNFIDEMGGIMKDDILYFYEKNHYHLIKPSLKAAVVYYYHKFSHQLLYSLNHKPHQILVLKEDLLTHALV
jgi:hypothetical protein